MLFLLKHPTSSKVLDIILLINEQILRYLSIDKNLLCYKLLILGIFTVLFFLAEFSLNVKTGQKGSTIPSGHKLTTLSKKIPQRCFSDYVS